MDLFSPSLRNLWKDWELRILVLLSLVLQIVLIFIGNRRKYTRRTWIRIVVWCAYLMADWVATVALGVISNNLGDIMNSSGKDESPNDAIYLTAFWAPFLLLHLGGPDTITAYSLEDNELWLRHLLGLVVQTGVALYIFFIAWTGSRLSFLSILMFFPGIIKYGERTWVLRSASNEQFRKSMLTSPDPGPNYSKFMREYTLKQFEGFYVIAEEVIEKGGNVSSVENDSIHDDTELVIAYDLFKTFKRLFVDLILGFDDRDNSQSLFEKFSWNKAFKVIEMELGFMYDVLYTKGTVIHSTQGWCLRIISFFFTSITLALFLLTHKLKHSEIDLVLTFLLLSIAILLEVYAFLLLVSSDWTNLLLSKSSTSSIRQVITRLQLPKQPRWSNSMSQFNLLSFSLKDKRTVFIGIQKRLCMDEFLENYNYTTCEEVPDNLKELLILYKCEVLKEYNHSELEWSVEVEFDRSILIWHVATDICYQSDLDQIQRYPNTFMLQCEFSTLVSQCMMYLLVICPLMLPMGIGMIWFQHTCTEITHFFEAHKSMEDKSDIDKILNTYSWAMSCIQAGIFTLDKSHACEKLFRMIIQVPPSEVERERSKSVLFDACRLASDNVWVEMLAYAACHCRGNHHAQQLRQGEELLTHVWLLMAHFGINEQFQTS
ncbi:hypothetical protein ACJW30_05G011600 [Castanea mollissima]